MSKHTEPLRLYKYDKLMEELNDMILRIKVHTLSGFPDEVRKKYSLPTCQELDSLNTRLQCALRENSELMKKYSHD